MLGKRVYYLYFKDRCVKNGVITSIHVSTNGYTIYNVRSDDGFFMSVEKLKCFQTEEEAQKALKEKIVISDEIDKTIKETNERVDELRKQIIGEPDLPELA